MSAGAAGGHAMSGAVRDPLLDEAFAELVRRVSDRYTPAGVTAREFARGKLRGDPLYRTVLTGGLLPSGGTLLDVGCGQGLTLAALVEAARMAAEGAWPAAVAPPAFDRLVGIELRPRVAAIASTALGGDAEIVTADVRAVAPGRLRVVLMFDVLHLLPSADQLRLIAEFADALEADGAMLVREADAAAGWRFQAVRVGNALKALAFGRLSQRFHFRTAQEWAGCFEARRFRVQRHATDEGTPFANVLFVLQPEAPRAG